MVIRMKDKALNIFLIIQGGCYAAFLFLDLKGDHISISTGIKLSIILLCFLYTLWMREGESTRDMLLLRVALFFTFLSDFIILLLPAKAYIYGVGSFLIVQQLYGIRLKCGDNRRRGLPEPRGLFSYWLLRLASELFAALLILLGLYLADVSPDGLLIASTVYFISLVFNVIGSIRLALRKPSRVNHRIFAAGLLLFLLCDINVGLFNLSGYISLSGKAGELIYRLSSILMWTFYAPSQVLIAVSGERTPSILTKKLKKIM